MSAPEFVVAVDLGGSLTKIAAATPDGRLSRVERLPTRLGGTDEALLQWLAEQIRRLAHSGPGCCLGYGVVVPGIIDATTGTVRAAPNVGWYNVPVAARLSALTGLPGAVGHDVRSGGLAEWRLGAGVGVANLLFLPLGTGIAGAMVVDGNLLEADGYAGEIGHVRVGAAEQLPCACGQRGCLETVTSAAGVSRSYGRLSGTSGPSPLPDAQQVAERARAGEPAARAAYDVAAEGLAEALLVYLTLLAPEVVIIGGGLAGALDLFLPQIDAELRSRATLQRLPRIVPATLGADAGLVGAGLIGRADAARRAVTR
ncbi:MAG TPA: ROK family protein [Propionibacteriaceae bacterium]|nr:ROK family protein [Propionibacteriaceae bacterium]